MNKLDYKLLREVKQAFVPQPGGGGEPVAGASDMTAGLASPMGDPAAAGGMPPAGLDPAMAGMPAGQAPAPAAPPPTEGGTQAPTSGASITITIDDLIRVIESVAKVAGGGKGSSKSSTPGAAPAAGGQPPGDPRIDQILGMLQTAMGPAAGAGAPPPGGAAPAQ